MKQAVFVDVDNVLVKAQTQRLLIKFLRKKGIISWGLFLKIYLWFLGYRLGILHDVIKIRKSAFKAFRGIRRRDIEPTIDIFFREYVLPNVSKKIRDDIAWYLQAGDEVVLLSASLQEIVERLARHLCLRHYFATQLEVEGERYTGRILGPVPYGEEKAKLAESFLARHGLSRENSYAYCDHYSDLPLLEFVRHPVIVNPDRRLKKIAISRGWKIIRDDL